MEIREIKMTNFHVIVVHMGPNGLMVSGDQWAGIASPKDKSV
jgi:hypothetical protein